jgi:regulator of telomere elongation helicase 1
MFVAKSSKRSTTSNTSKSNKDEPIKDKSQIKSQAAASPPTTLELRGVQIHFPFKPYKCQEDYMGKVLDALNGKENALLESPTGTGKTLCLLCSTLAWQQEQARLLADNNSHIDQDLDSKVDCASSNEQLPATQAQPARTRTPTIIYASRTHSQLSQVVKEMRFTRYRPKHAVLGSREQMCVHPKVRTANATSADINHNCTSLNKERKCRFRNNLEGFVVNGCGADGGSSKGEQYEFGMQPVLDMEELVDLGKKRKVCPFYLSRGQIADADIIFVPYNYLFDKDARSNTLSEVCWEDAILVFDEAHNLESFASESASFDLSSVDIAGCVNEVARAIGYLQAMPEVGEGVKMENLIRLKSIFLQMEQYLENQVAPNGGSFTGEYIFEIFAKGANLNHSNHAVFLKFIKQVSDMVMEMRGGTGGSSSATTSGTPKLDHFVGCVKRVFGTATEGQSFANARAYRVHVSPKTSGQTGKSNSTGGGFVGHGNKPSSGRVLSYWCFAPSLAMHELAALNVRSILVTSGTLSPLPSYSLELGLPFPHTLENAHIIGKDQISVRVIGKGVSGKELTSTYNRRDNAEYISELGNTIISLAKVIPGGMLIFFPSYSVMENCIERWGGPLSSRSRTQNYGKKNFFQAKQKRESSSGNTGRNCFPHSALGYNQVGSATPWQRLIAVKAIVLEPKTTAELKDVINEFDKFISLPKSSGCIMMGVCRGKISEGETKYMHMQMLI